MLPPSYPVSTAKSTLPESELGLHVSMRKPQQHSTGMKEEGGRVCSLSKDNTGERATEMWRGAHCKGPMEVPTNKPIRFTSAMARRNQRQGDVCHAVRASCILSSITIYSVYSEVARVAW